MERTHEVLYCKFFFILTFSNPIIIVNLRKNVLHAACIYRTFTMCHNYAFLHETY